jgi:hypothetical protein
LPCRRQASGCRAISPRGECGTSCSSGSAPSAFGPSALGDDAPTGPILGARVEHLFAKEALLADDPEVFFTTPHFDGYPAVLVRLDEITLDELEEVIVEAWLSRATKRLAKEYLESL